MTELEFVADRLKMRGLRVTPARRAVLAAVVKHLKARRRPGRAGRAVPTGFLTHHLAEDRAGWRFIDRFLAETTRHPAARWLDAARLFGAAP